MPAKRKAIVHPHFTPIFIVTGVMLVVFIVGLVFPKGPNAGLIRTCISLTAVCMYFFWLVMYMAQMNPIMCPKMANTSLAWMSVTWGDEAV